MTTEEQRYTDEEIKKGLEDRGYRTEPFNGGTELHVFASASAFTPLMDWVQPLTETKADLPALVRQMAAGERARRQAFLVLGEIARWLHNAGDVCLMESHLSEDSEGSLRATLFAFPAQIHQVYSRTDHNNRVLVIILPAPPEAKGAKRP